jgi:chemotaxis protein methyltransferase CheR
MTFPAGISRTAPVSAAQSARVRALIEDRCGLNFHDSRRSSLHSSLRARMDALGIASLDAYYDRLRDPGEHEEFRNLINLITITETCFFRDPAQFQMLRRQIIPALLASRPAGDRKTLRIWSAGCASGEEAYSVAITICEMRASIQRQDVPFEIVATDVNTDMLAAARRGIYSPRAVRNVDPDLLGRYFKAGERQFTLDAEVMRLVQFEHGSLTKDTASPAGGYDIILCKNVAIYFRSEVTRRLIGRLHAALNDGGYLLLGHSESLWGMDQPFTLVEHDGVFCYRKPHADVQADAVPAAVSSARAARRDVVPFADPVSQYDRCVEAFRGGDWIRAEAGVRALLRVSPTCVPAHLLLAGIHAHLGRYADARDVAEQVLRLDAREAKAHLLLGMVAARAGRHDDAIAALGCALDLDDSLALAYFWLGNLYRDRGDVERACREHAEAVRRYERRQLSFTEEFAADLHPAQIVDFCRQSARRLRSAG